MSVDHYQELYTVLEKIRRLAAIDMAHKTKGELFLSAAEEFGELAKEIKVEQEVFCNAHKKLDEGSKGESVDLFICCAAMMFAIEPDFDIDAPCEYYETTATTSIGMLCEIADYIPEVMFDIAANQKVMRVAIDIFRLSEDDIVAFFDYVNKKVDKWESKQLKELESKQLT